MNLHFFTYSTIPRALEYMASNMVGSELAAPEGEFKEFMAGRETQFHHIDGRAMAKKARAFYEEYLRELGFDVTIGCHETTNEITGLSCYANHDRTGELSRHIFRLRSYEENKGVATALLGYELKESAKREEKALHVGKNDVDIRYPNLGRVFDKVSADSSIPASYAGNGIFDIELSY